MKIVGIERLVSFLIAMVSLFLLSGCWSSIELNERAFVQMILLDKSKEGIELTVALPLTNRLIPGMAGGTGGRGEPHTFLTHSGTDISQAYRRIQTDLSRKISFGQTRIIVIGQELAEEGLEPILDFLAREPTFHINASLFVTSGNAKQVIKVPPIFERFTTDILGAYVELNNVVTTTIVDFLQANYRGGDIVIPLLVFEQKNIEEEKPKEQTWMGTDGAALFKKGKLVGRLSTGEMRAGLWILGQLKDAEITVASPTDGKDISFIINQAHTRIKPRITGETISIDIYNKADAGLISTDSNMDLRNLNHLKALEQSLNEKVNNAIIQAIDKTKEVQSDVFHFGQYVDWNYPRAWKRVRSHWRQLYSDSVKIDVHTEVDIKRLGTVRQAVHIIDHEDEVEE